MKEWKPIVGYEDYYLISNEGDVFSLRSNRLIRSKDRGNGYYYIELNVDGNSKKHLIHRLVAEAFIPNPNNYPVINHKDENPANNCVDNLEWCTYKYNSNYGTQIERRVKHTTYHRGADNIQSHTTYQFDLEGNLIATYGSLGEAERATGLSAGVIRKVVLGKMRKYGGYYWNDKNEFNYNPTIDGHFIDGAVLKYDLNGNFVKRYALPKELRADGFSPSNVARVIRGERKSYHGYTFKREDAE